LGVGLLACEPCEPCEPIFDIKNINSGEEKDNPGNRFTSFTRFTTSPADDFLSQHPPSPSVETRPPQVKKPLVCTWNGLDRLITKCDYPEPNADGTGCATCGAVKADDREVF